MALLDLIDDLKAAKRSNTVLDEALAIVAGYKRVVEGQRVQWVAPGSGHPAPLPNFTKNIDAACKLIKILTNAEIAGCSWEPGKGTAKIGDGPYCIAANPAIALCIAGLTHKLHGEYTADVDSQY